MNEKVDLRPFVFIIVISHNKVKITQFVDVITCIEGAAVLSDGNASQHST